eukprot:SAG31_NODE_639_length_13309_cov_4.008468_9_plen_73_part_00
MHEVQRSLLPAACTGARAALSTAYAAAAMRSAQARGTSEVAMNDFGRTPCVQAQRASCERQWLCCNDLDLQR